MQCRYGGQNAALHNPDTVCSGECDGAGVFPLKSHKWLSGKDERNNASPPPLVAAEQRMWDDAEACQPTKDGWHFVKCPTCGGTGKKK